MCKFSFSQFIESKKLSACIACITVVCCSSAFAQSSIDDYLTSLKETSLIDDVNIEDDVLVNNSHPEVLTSSCPKEIDELESIIGKG